MLVVHGCWAYGVLYVWAEDSALPALAPPRAGRPSRAPRPHPFAVPAGRLAEALAEALAGTGADGPDENAVGDPVENAVEDELTLRLPSVAGGPLASPDLIRPAETGEAPAGRVRPLAGSGPGPRARPGGRAAGRPGRAAAR